MQGFDNQVVGDQVERFLDVAIRIVTLVSTEFTRQRAAGDQAEISMQASAMASMVL